MKRLFKFFALILCSAWSVSSHGTVFLDDTWTDGTRTDQNLPSESSWFASTGAALTAAPGAMTLSLGSSAVLGITYFTSGINSPVQLQLGDTLTASFTIVFSGLASPNGSEGFRIGIFDFADSTLATKRVTADGMSSSSQGSGVQGYALFQNVGTSFGSAFPIDLRKRTTLTDASLLGTSGDYTSLGFGPGDTNSFPGFSNGGTNVLRLSVQKTGANSITVSAVWFNQTTGASLSSFFVDSSATNFSFDGIALRPQSAASSASTITFTEAKVELIAGSTPPTINVQPADQAPFLGQNASFSVDVTGTPPLRYQWYFNTNTLIPNATNATLTLTNVTSADAGTYQVSITNDSGGVVSDPAILTVNVPDPPSITAQPLHQTVSVGQNVTLSVSAQGTQPLAYQWFYNGATPLAARTNTSLILTNVQVADAGDYSVLVTNFVGSVTSSAASLWVSNTPVPPSFDAQPASQIVVTGSLAVFSATATGSSPLSYQWSLDGVPLAGATTATLNLTNVLFADAGTYTLAVTNAAGTATTAPVLLTVASSVGVPFSAYNLAGFAQSTIGGGTPAENSASYKKVYTAVDLALAVADKTGTIKVIEIMNDLNLGYNEIPADAKTNSEPFRAHNLPLLHPVLLHTGVSLIDIQKRTNLTIFSTNGVTLRHATLNFKNCGNIIIRNLKFDEMWEWDESTKGQYDRNDWDFIDLGNSGTVSNIWVDHCTFTKAYDGISDIKEGSFNITFSWCKYTGDDGATNTNSWVRQQINTLETNRSAYAMYNFLRNNGYSVEDIVAISQGHDKTHLIGATTDPINAQHRVTFHHDWFINPWDRLPRLRGGNIHDYNIYVDGAVGLAARRLRDSRAAAMSPASSNTLNNTYSFRPPLNGTISTENGATLVEKSVYIGCLTPLRNNQTDPNNPTYTGKILALDTVYQMDSTVVRGNSTDAGNPLGPFQAPIIPFSWNLPNNQLPYAYTTDDPSQLKGIVTDPNFGAAAGVLTWAKTNWLVTQYPASAPTIAGQPLNQTRAPGQAALFVVVAGGSGPLFYQWYLNTNSPIPNATNAALSLASVQAGDAGSYSVIVSNSLGVTNSSFAMLNITAAPAGFGVWQNAHFTQAQLADPLVSGANAAPAGDGVVNFVKYALVLDPFATAVQPLVGFRLESGSPVLTYQRPVNVPDATYVPQISSDLVNWSVNGLTQQQVSSSNGIAFWEVDYSGPDAPTRFLRLSIQR